MFTHSSRLTAPKIAHAIAWLSKLEYAQRHNLAPLEYLPNAELSHACQAAQTDPTAWRRLSVGEHWGALNEHFILRGNFQVPSDFDRTQPIALRFDLGDAGDFCHPEGLLYVDEQPICAVDRFHQEILLLPAWCDGEWHSFCLAGWAGSIAQDPNRRLHMGTNQLVQIHPATRSLLNLMKAALQTAELIAESNPIKANLLNALNQCYLQLDLREPLGLNFYASATPALAQLQTALQQAGNPLPVEVIAAGHAHIDVAWLWELAQTRKKAARTFFSVLHLMAQFPQYHFSQSQPQLYQYILEDFPALFAQIQERVREGRWEVLGGMWVEADCNLSGSEALARQFLLGRSFFRQHFGNAESPVLWLPDVFGYSASLPQLIKLAGMEYFFTIKIGWNQVNKMPYDSFWWQGLDGTRVLTHFSTTPEMPWSNNPPNALDLFNSATYNANLNAFTALGSWEKLKQKDSQRTLLMSYGYGDGGGGPTREMNENAQILHAFPGVPQIRQGRVIDFFRQLQRESGEQLPTWENELYLEIHRGTYTTQSRTKRANRKNEVSLHNAELLATQASQIAPGYAYPHAQLTHAWRLLCLNQFHDIIPGSSIRQVYVDSAAQHAEIAEISQQICETALDVLAQASGGDWLLVNPTAFERQDVAFWAGEDLPAMQDGWVQAVAGGWLVGGFVLAPFGRVALKRAVQPNRSLPQTSLNAQAGLPAQGILPVLENDFLRVEFWADGDISRIFDKQHPREVLPPHSRANQFQAFVDRPLNWDAWDIDIFYDDQPYFAEPASQIRVVENGPLRATLEITRKILHSSYIQRVSLTYNQAQLDFVTEIDWQEKHILLKTAFPVQVLAGQASHEVQWGHVQRPTHRNTSWDWARFETAAQKWVDLSEGGYGVALLNDCKYGHDVWQNVLRLSLLRAPTFPDATADEGLHRFAYSLLPHANPPGANLVASHVAKAAYCLNNPLLLHANPKPAVIAHFAAQPAWITAPENWIIETVKQAEDGAGLILRLYECNRQRGSGVVKFGFAVRQVERCNLMEETLEAVAVQENSVQLALRPFEIVTLRVR
ncbi:MAG TPA: glycoside hydrolase family 38 C-terminal domain-containing protein [Anaerolineales bacterium]|nr:glycoside hydrolase family 38 C-terminal domain-containing protein [Anaerolineales bacterium]